MKEDPKKQESIQAAAMEALHQAESIIQNPPATAKSADVDTDDIADKFQGLPMSELIGAPMFAAAEAQERLAALAWQYYQKVAFDGEGDKKTTRILEFDLERPVIEEDKTPTLMRQQVKAPFIGLVPIPALLIDRVDVDFQMEVTDTNVNKSNTQAEVSTDISANLFFTKASISGKVSTSRENTRTTNQTAKYQVHVSASQQPRTEGLAKLMDIMASCIEPIPVKSK